MRRIAQAVPGLLALMTLVTLGVGGAGLGCKSATEVENEREKRLRRARVRKFQRARARELARKRRLEGAADATAGKAKVVVVAAADGGTKDATALDAMGGKDDPAQAPSALLGEGPKPEPYDGKPDTLRPALVTFKKWDGRPLKQREALSPVINASTSFAVDLLGRLGRRRENVSVAPWSLWSGMTLLAGGATGQTRKQLRRLLHLAVADDVLRKRYKTLQALHQRGLRSAGVKLRVASGLWTAQGLKLRPDATKGQLGVGQATIQRADIKGDPEKARKAMNRWVAGRTSSKEADLVGRGVLHVDVKLLLTSAASLTGALGKLFPKNGTFQGTFYLPGCQMVQVPMMNSRKLKYFYSKSRDVELVDIPLRGGAVSLTVIQPRRGETLAELQSKLTSAKLRWWFGTLVAVTGKVTLPRLEIGVLRDLAAVFKELGATGPFAKGATFGKLADPGALRLETVLHRTPLILRETGRAAPKSRPRVTPPRRRRRGLFYPLPPRGATRRSFYADRSFVLLLRHRATGAILYLARIYNPRPGGRVEKNPGCVPKLSHRFPGLQRRRRRRRWSRFSRWSRQYAFRYARVVGGLDAEDVHKELKKHRTAVTRCVTDGYQAKPPLKGQVEVGFTIRTDGTVGGVHLTFRKRRHATTRACLRKVVQGWTFPKNPAEATVVSFTLGRI